MESVNELRRLYSDEQLKDICSYGCITGVASHHIYHTECEDFYNKYSDEILDQLELITGENPLHFYSKDAYSLEELTTKIVWSYIEEVSFHLLEEVDESSAKDC